MRRYLSRASSASRLGAPTAVARTRFACFDGLRAIAAITVVGVHTAFASGFTTGRPSWGRYTCRLEIGVEVFFVISGFLLYRPFVKAHLKGSPAPEAKRFWIRRIKRIVPAYWVAFLVVTYLTHGDKYPHTWASPLVYLGFAQIYMPRFALGGLTQAWSLCTEMTFYFFIPVYAWALVRKHRSQADQLKAELIGLLVLVGISVAWRIPILTIHTSPNSVVRTMPNWLPGYIDQFALGMLLAVGSCWYEITGWRPTFLWHRSTPWVCWTLSALCFWAVSNIGLPLIPLVASPAGPSLLRQTLYGLFAFFLVLPAVFGNEDQGLIRKFLQWKPMALAGVVSYGIYLWHETWIYSYISWGHKLFAMPWLQMYAVVTALGIATATLSYVLLERPILRSGRNPRSPKSKTPETTVEATVAAGVAI